MSASPNPKVERVNVATKIAATTPNVDGSMIRTILRQVRPGLDQFMHFSEREARKSDQTPICGFHQGQRRTAAAKAGCIAAIDPIKPPQRKSLASRSTDV